MRNLPRVNTKVQWTNAKHFRPKWQLRPDAVGSPSLLINFLYLSEFELIIDSTVRNSVVPFRCTRKDGTILLSMNIKERRLAIKKTLQTFKTLNRAKAVRAKSATVDVRWCFYVHRGLQQTLLSYQSISYVAEYCTFAFWGPGHRHIKWTRLTS